GEAGIQGSPGIDGEYCACPPKSLPGIYSIPKPAPVYPQQPYYSTSYQNSVSPAVQPYYTTPTTQSPHQYPSSTYDTFQPTSTEIPSHHPSANPPSYLTKHPGLRIVDSFWKHRRTE
ncbi:hypothetical protein PRIPAC_90425, partial [Pristionchus pacificus]